jgi:hypothetical protein
VARYSSRRSVPGVHANDQDAGSRGTGSSSRCARETEWTRIGRARSDRDMYLRTSTPPTGAHRTRKRKHRHDGKPPTYSSSPEPAAGKPPAAARQSEDRHRHRHRHRRRHRRRHRHRRRQRRRHRFCPHHFRSDRCPPPCWTRGRRRHRCRRPPRCRAHEGVFAPFTRGAGT